MSEDERQDRLDERLRDLAREAYHPPPEPPREAMWARIEDELRGRSSGEPHAARRESSSAAPRWLRWGVGLAAVLAVGVGLGRLSTPSTERPNAVATAPDHDAESGPTAARDRRGGRSATYRLAAAQVLSQAEVLLTTFDAEGDGRTLDPQTAAWAREVLSTTRLLMDSPAAQDPRLHGLLQDLELALVQIVQLPNGGDAGERAWIAETVKTRDVLTRLRAATTPRATDAET